MYYPPPGAPGAVSPGQPPQPGAVPHPPGPGAPPPAPAPGPPKRKGLAVALGILGTLLLLIGGGIATAVLVISADTEPNHAAYGPSMWRNEPVDRVLPKTLAVRPRGGDTPVSDPRRAEWHRLGISPETDCDAALSLQTRKEVKKAGCKGVLRATYVDPTGNTVATIALIALPSEGKEQIDMYFQEMLDDHMWPAVRTLAVPNTLAAGWTGPDRNGGAGQVALGSDLPYGIAAVAGAVDGRRAGQLPGEWGRTQYDARNDRNAWAGASTGLTEALSFHLGELLRGEVS